VLSSVCVTVAISTQTVISARRTLLSACVAVLKCPGPDLVMTYSPPLSEAGYTEIFRMP